MLAVFLMESTVRKLDPEFNLLEGLFARAGAVLQQAEQGSAAPELDRLRFEGFLLARQGPRSFGRLVHEVRAALQTWEFRRSRPPGPDLDLLARRLGSAIVAAGLVAASTWLLIEHVGPEALGVPVLPAIGFGLGAWMIHICLRGERA